MVVDIILRQLRLLTHFGNSLNTSSAMIVKLFFDIICIEGLKVGLFFYIGWY
jgi:hypothetical protein